MVKTTVRLREDQVEAVRKASRRRGLSFSATVRELIREELAAMAYESDLP